MTCAKLVLIVTNADARRRLVATWHDFVIRQPGASPASGPGSQGADGPVAFSQLRIREGLNLALFIVDGGWRREYVCQVLAQEADGYCLLVGGTTADLSAGLGLVNLVAETRPGLIAGTVAGSEPLLRRVLNLSPDANLPVVDCDDRSSAMAMICELLERVAAAAAA